MDHTCLITPTHWSSKDFKLISLRILVNLLKESKDPQILAVACNDIGQFVKFGGYPAKKYFFHIDYLGILSR
jgi:V-ATPase subunit H